MKYDYFRILIHGSGALPTLLMPVATMICYALAINYIRFTKLYLVSISVFLLISSIILEMWLGELFRLSNDTSSLLIFIPYILFLYSWGFPTLQYYFVKRWINNDQKFHDFLHPKDADDLIEYHQKPGRVIALAYVLRYSLFMVGLSLIVAILIAAAFKLDMFIPPGIYYMYFFTLLAVIFTVSMAYLRLFVRCPNCNVELYYIEENASAYLHTAKYAVKKRIIQCVHCNATYILDKNKNYQMAKKEIDNMKDIRKSREAALANYRGYTKPTYRSKLKA